MTKNNGFKVAALAASIALAMGSTAAFAADPAATQLPGVGTGTAGISPGAIAAGEQTISVTGMTQVINWGKAGGTINATGTDAQPAGFNVGSSAKLHFEGQTAGGDAVLNIDSTGNPSQIMGLVDDAGSAGAMSIFVANANGIIVGADASISSAAGAVGLVANTLDTAPTFTGAGATGGLVYNGTGGDVTVQSGASLSGATVFVAGGGNVNVDLGATTGTVSLSAGLPSSSTFTTKNTSANINVTGPSATALTGVSLSSAGTATTAGKLGVSTNAVAGTLTNSGELALPTTGNNDVVNNGTLTTGAATAFRSLTNNGSFNATGATTFGGTGSSGKAGSLVNNGSIDAGAAAIVVNDGSITNNGSITNAISLTTQSDSADGGFVAGGQYYITNAGTIEDDGAGALTIDANKTTHTTTGTVTNDSTGSFTNTGSLKLSKAGDLTVNANNGIALGGSVLADDGTGTYKALSKDNELGSVSLTGVKGTVTVSAPVAFATAGTIAGNQVKLMNNVTSGTATTPTGTLKITAGDAPTGDYSIRVAAGKTASAATVQVLNATGKSASTILQGTLAGDDITFGSTTSGVGDIISGPAGGISASTTLDVNFTGRLKTAPYLNNPNNFRYNYLPITNTGTGSLLLTLNPTKYTTNGTSNGLSGVNVLVNGDVELVSGAAYVAPSSAVTGVANTPNTHIVLQSTGNIDLNTTAPGTTYWPGYVYLGTVDSDSDGNALPGTLSDGGQITLGGNLSNVLPGDVAGASGIHFMSGKPLAGAFNVATNANALINFPNDTLTQAYATGLLTSPTFTGGTAAGLVVTYSTLAPEFFFTHPVDATK